MHLAMDSTEKKSEKINLILMPGLNGTKGLFSKFITQIPVQFNVVVMSYPTDKEMDYDELTVYTSKILSKIDGPKILIGESFSGPIALRVANSLKDVEGIILVASFRSAPRSTLFKYVPWEAFFIFNTPMFQIFRMIASTKFQIILDILSEIKAVSHSVLAGRMRSIFSLKTDSFLEELSIPIFYLQGEYDPLVPKSALQKIRKKASVEMASLPTHHFILQTMPKEAWTVIEAFITQIRNLDSK